MPELETGPSIAEETISEESVSDVSSVGKETLVEQFSDVKEPTAKISPTQIETMKRVKTNSVENYESFINSEALREGVIQSVSAAAELYVLTDLDPQLEFQVNEFVPDYKNFQRGTPGKDENARDAAFSIMSGTESARRETGKAREREAFIRDLFLLGGIIDKDGELVSKGEFREKVREKAVLISERLLQNAKISAEQELKDLPQIMLTVRENSLKELFKTGEYKARLDSVQFSEEYTREIDEVIKTTEKDPSYNNKWVSLEGLGRRKVRQVQLGIDGKPNPVYAEVVADPELELKELRNRGYGDIHLVLKPEVQDRSVFATGDTVADRAINVQLAWREAVKSKKVLNSFKQQSEFVDWTVLPEYVEAHILGGVSVNDVDECLFEPTEDNAKILEYFKTYPGKFRVQEDREDLVRVKFL